jgi:hypothetical protein
MLASAWANYIEVASGALQSGSTRRTEEAQKRAEALEPKLATLSVEVADPVEGLVLTRNGEPVPAAEWNVAVPVDPGTYQVRAEAPGHEAREYDVVIDEPKQAAEVKIAPLMKKVTAKQEQPGDDATTAAREAPVADGKPAGDDGSPLTTAGLIVGGIGFAQAIAGAVLLSLGDGMMAEADEMCPDRICPPSDTGTDYVAQWKEGRDLGYMGIITLVGGQATLIIGIVMLGFGGEEEESGQARAPLWIEPRFDHGSASLTVGGTW